MAVYVSFFSIIFFSTDTPLYAASIHSDPKIIVAPHCLIKKIPLKSYHLLASYAEIALIRMNTIDTLVNAKNSRDKTTCGGFVDVSDSWNEFNSANPSIKQSALLFLKRFDFLGKQTSALTTVDYKIRYKTQVNQLLQTINPQFMWDSLTLLTQFPDRYIDSENGVKAAKWFKEQIEKMAAESGRSDISVQYVQTGNYKQPSVVAKIGASTKAGVVIGGHMDTLSSRFGIKPGADDDGSGSVTTLEVARTLITSGMKFSKPIYIIWYAGEEEGLIGSGYVVKYFKAKTIPVDAVLQFDMTGYASKNEPTLWLMTDNVNKNLTDFLETLINEYVKQPVGRTRCGYQCSDHASWNNGGYPASFPFEAANHMEDPYIHTSQDKMEFLSLNHMSDFAKLGIAFAVELAEPEGVGADQPKLSSVDNVNHLNKGLKKID